MPLATDSSTASSCMAGATRAAVARIAPAGHGKDDELVGRAKCVRISGDLDLDRDVDVGQVARVASLRGQAARLFLVTCEEHRPGRGGPAEGRASCPRCPAPTTARRGVAIHRQATPGGGRGPRARAARAAAGACPCTLAFLACSLADEQAHGRAAEAERLAQPVLEVAAVAEVDASRRRWRRARTSAARSGPGWRRRNAAACRAPSPAAGAA